MAYEKINKFNVTQELKEKTGFNKLMKEWKIKKAKEKIRICPYCEIPFFYTHKLQKYCCRDHSVRYCERKHYLETGKHYPRHNKKGAKNARKNK